MRILREPLVHFLLLGAGLFGVSLLGGTGTGAGAATASDKQIVVTAEKVELLRNGFHLDNGRDPTEAELQRLIDNYVREEVLVREARAQGLDRDDSVVRRRLVEKMEFAVAEPATPSDGELGKYLDQHKTAFEVAGGSPPALAEIHAAVLAAWMREQRETEFDEMYRRSLAGYQVSIQMPKATTAGAK
jgi:hypothetical protein